MKGTAIPAMPTTSLTQAKTPPTFGGNAVAPFLHATEDLADLYGRGAHFVLVRDKRPIWKRYQYRRNRPTLAQVSQHLAEGGQVRPSQPIDHAGPNRD